MAAKGTIEDELRRAAAQLADARIERARVDAELLLAHVLGVRRVDLLMHGDRPLAAAESEAFAALVRRRAARTPLPYLTGEREFMGLSFRVNEHVLIPRPETELLVETALQSLGEGQEAGTPLSWPSPVLLDIGTGSGAIAVSLARLAPEARVIATDVSPEACALARKNAARLGVADRVTILEGDLLAPVIPLFEGLPPEERVAVICANLPYVPAESLDTLQPEVRDWEPRLALDGGPGGLRLVERLLAQAPAVLRPGGLVLLEIGPEAEQPARMRALLAASGRFRDVRILPDLAGLPRVAAARLADRD